MKREDMQDTLTRLFLKQSCDLSGRHNPSYFRVMNHFDGKDDLTIKHLYEYIKDNPVSMGSTLTDLYTGEIKHRQEEFWEYRKEHLPEYIPDQPYSVEQILAL